MENKVYGVTIGALAAVGLPQLIIEIICNIWKQNSYPHFLITENEFIFQKTTSQKDIFCLPVAVLKSVIWIWK